MEKATKHGIKTQNLPKIILKIGGIAGEKTAIWRRMRININSKTTGRQHLEEIYLSENARDNIISYETLQNLGYITKNNTGKLETITIGEKHAKVNDTEKEKHHGEQNKIETPQTETREPDILER